MLRPDLEPTVLVTYSLLECRHMMLTPMRSWQEILPGAVPTIWFIVASSSEALCWRAPARSMRNQNAPAHGFPDPRGSDEAPDIFTAMQQQLGLKLESTKALVDVLVIDKVEKPSDN